MAPTDSDLLDADDIGLPTGDPSPFPQDDESTVVDWAAEIDAWIAAGGAVAGLVVPGGGAFLAAVTGINDIIKSILGDPQEPIDAALGWADAAKVALMIKDALDGQLIVLNSYWEGAAQGAFTEHLTAMLSALDATSAKLTLIAKKVAEAYSLVLDTWESSIAFLNDCAANLAGLMALPFSIVEAGSFIKGFIDAAANLYESALGTMNDYRRNILDLSIDATTFPTLPDNPEVLDRVEDVDDWEVIPD